MATKSLRLVHAFALSTLILIVPSAVADSNRIDSAGRFVHFSGKTAQTDANACVTYQGALPTRARVLVVNKKGHICDVEGSIQVSDEKPSIYVLRTSAEDNCTLELGIARDNIKIDDVNGNCSLAWCGQGVFFAKRTLSLSAKQTNITCGAP